MKQTTLRGADIVSWPSGDYRSVSKTSQYFVLTSYECNFRGHTGQRGDGEPHPEQGDPNELDKATTQG